MKLQIEIAGMSCEGCVKNVEEALREIDGVQIVKGSLHPPYVDIEVKKSITSVQLMQALAKAGGYSITGTKLKKKSEKSAGSCCC